MPHQTNAVVTTPQTTPSAGTQRAEVLAGPHGTTFIKGDSGEMIGLDTSLNDLANSHDPTQFPDQILVRHAQVQTVIGDQVFSIGLTKGQSVIVKIMEPTQPGNLGENELVIRPGQFVAVSGQVRKINSIGQLSKEWGVSGLEAGQIGNTSIYIEANTVQEMNP
jgi:hypothetical protein